MQKWIIAVIIFIIILLGIFIVLNVDIETEYVPESEFEEQDLRKTIVSLYFKNKETKVIEEENRLIDSKELLKDPYEKLIKLLISGPENSNNEKVIPESVNLEKVKFENGIVCISFNQEFDKLLQEEKDLIFESIYKTLIKLNEVSDIRIITEENIKNEIDKNKNTTNREDENLENGNVISNNV